MVTSDIFLQLESLERKFNQPKLKLMSSTNCRNVSTKLKVVSKSVIHRMVYLRFNVCCDIKTNPGPGDGRHFMNYCFTQLGKFSCAVDPFLELAFAILMRDLKTVTEIKLSGSKNGFAL